MNKCKLPKMKNGKIKWKTLKHTGLNWYSYYYIWYACIWLTMTTISVAGWQGRLYMEHGVQIQSHTKYSKFGSVYYMYLHMNYALQLYIQSIHTYVDLTTYMYGTRNIFIYIKQKRICGKNIKIYKIQTVFNSLFRFHSFKKRTYGYLLAIISIRSPAALRIPYVSCSCTSLDYIYIYSRTDCG